MPLDGGRWELQLLAADKTASAFKSVETRMKSLDAQSKSTGSAMSAGFAGVARMLGPLAAGFTAAAWAQKVWSAGMAAGDLGEQAEQIGLTTDQLQAYRLAAAQSGIEAEQLDAAMMKLTKAMGAANDGSDEMIAKFEKLGVKLLDSSGSLRKVGDVMPELARGLLKVGSETERGALMQDLFGRSGMRMITVLEQLAQGNEKVIKTAKDLNAIIDGETIKAWDNLGDRLTVAKQQSETTWAQLGKPIAMVGLNAFNEAMLKLNALLAAGEIAGKWLFGNGADSKGGAFSTSSEDLIKRQATIAATLEVLKDSTDALDVAKVAGMRKELVEISDTLASRAKIVTMPEVVVSSTGAGQPTGNATKGGGAKEPKQQVDEIAKIIARLDQEAEAAAKTIRDQFGDGVGYAAREVSTLNDRLDRGLISAGEYDRAASAVAKKADDMDRAYRGAAGGFDGLKAGMEQGAAEMERMNSVFAAGQQMSKLLADSFVELATTGELNFQKLLASFANMISQMLIQAAAAAALRTIFGAFGGGGGGGGGGLLDGLFTSIFGSPFGFAEGGRPPVGEASWVGERGKELFVPDQAGTIFNRDQLAGMGGGGGGDGGGVTIVQHMTFGSDVNRGTLMAWGEQIKQQTISTVLDLKRRGGPFGRAFA